MVRVDRGHTQWIARSKPTIDRTVTMADFWPDFQLVESSRREGQKVMTLSRAGAHAPIMKVTQPCCEGLCEILEQASIPQPCVAGLRGCRMPGRSSRRVRNGQQPALRQARHKDKWV